MNGPPAPYFTAAEIATIPAGWMPVEVPGGSPDSGPLYGWAPTPAAGLPVPVLNPATVNLNLPAGFVDRTAQPAPGDGSPDANFYRQLPKIADYMASLVMAAAAQIDLRDNGGNDHKAGAQAAIAAAIQAYLMNFPYAVTAAEGYRATLARLLASPLFTWAPSIQQVQVVTSWGMGSVPAPFQLRKAGWYAVGPNFAPFYFWQDRLSFFRFLSYDTELGFLFSEAFVGKVCDCLHTALMFQATGGDGNNGRYGTGIRGSLGNPASASRAQLLQAYARAEGVWRDPPSLVASVAAAWQAQNGAGPPAGGWDSLAGSGT